MLITIILILSFFKKEMSVDKHKKKQFQTIVSLGLNRTGPDSIDSPECKIVCSAIVDGKHFYGQNAMKPSSIKHLYTC